MKSTKGIFHVFDFGTFKLHAYYTGDAMNDASYIVESAQALVTMEQPLFKENVAEFDAYTDSLGKSVEKRVADYHIGGTHDHPVVMPCGMSAFTKGPVYGGMMEHFAQIFPDITELPTGQVSEVEFGSTNNWAGIDFVFEHGASSDFPAARIIIGGKVCYTHWAPSESHMNALQIPSAEAIDSRLEEAKLSLASGAEIFIGGHGKAGDTETVKFVIKYLRTLKRILDGNATASSFVDAMKNTYPGLPGEEGLEAMAAALYI